MHGGGYPSKKECNQKELIWIMSNVHKAGDKFKVFVSKSECWEFIMNLATDDHAARICTHSNIYMIVLFERKDKDNILAVACYFIPDERKIARYERQIMY